LVDGRRIGLLFLRWNLIGVNLYPSQEGRRMSVASESFYDRSMELPDELLRGAIDSHIHAGPVLMSNPGRLDPFQVAEQAKDAGMKAIVFYDVFGTSGGTAWLVSRRISGIQIFGGMILSSCQGGLNPRAVKTALYYGAGVKFVSLGAHCTHFKATTEARVVDGKLVPIKDLCPKFAKEEVPRAIRIPLEDPLFPELEEILQLISDRPDVYLNTGHVSGDEVMRLINLAERFNIKKVLVAHPARLQLTIEQQKEATRRGAFLEGALVDWLYPSVPRTHYYVEREYMDETCLLKGRMTASAWANQIKAIGPEHFVLATDYGIRAAATPLEGMRTLITTLLDMEFSLDEIQTMTAKNPARLLGLD
jgi:hypothetical protein